MRVAGDDHVGICRDGALQNSVVRVVISHDAQPLPRIYKGSEAADRLNGLTRARLGPAELSDEDPFDFVEYRGRDEDFDGSNTSAAEDIFGRTREI